MATRKRKERPECKKKKSKRQKRVEQPGDAPLPDIMSLVQETHDAGQADYWDKKRVLLERMEAADDQQRRVDQQELANELLFSMINGQSLTDELKASEGKVNALREELENTTALWQITGHKLGTSYVEFGKLKTDAIKVIGEQALQLHQAYAENARLRRLVSLPDADNAAAH